MVLANYCMLLVITCNMKCEVSSEHQEFSQNVVFHFESFSLRQVNCRAALPTPTKQAKSEEMANQTSSFGRNGEKSLGKSGDKFI